MYNKLNNLAFVIGAFFTIVALIMFGNIVFSAQYEPLSIYSASAFFIFGLLMMIKG